MPVRSETGALRARAIAAIVAGLVVLGLVPGAAQAARTGKVAFMLNAKSSFDPYVQNADPATQRFVRKKYWRARAYPPFYDRALGWSAPSYFYKDLYAIYRGREDALIAQHPSWVLRDSGGQPLYLQFGCSGGTCPQYAADIGNPQWRAHWIADAADDMAKGYIGVHIDDVNMFMRVSNGAGDPVRPTDPRTGAPMTDANWRRYTAEFVEEIRAELPNAWISHNPIWWASHNDPFVRRQVAAADAIELERGFSDGGLTKGGGKFGFMTFLRHIKWLHARGKSIILQPYDLNRHSEREFELASYFLAKRGADAITSDDRSYPDNWWPGWGTNLGRPRGNFRMRKGVLVRKFARGIVIVRQPGSTSKRVKLGRRYTRLTGRRVRTVRLDAGEGAVLFKRRGFRPRR